MIETFVVLINDITNHGNNDGTLPIIYYLF